MDETQYRLVMSGRIAQLPPINSKIIRIFISSTFTDTNEERNLLMESVYPRLKEYCKKQYGLEFQVVDMRWGVRDEVTDDHMTSTLCFQEIQNCQKLSIGPNFVAFLGQRHGYRPFPPQIKSEIFQLMCNTLKDLDKDVRLLHEWFREDTNSIPSVFVLQPISSKLPNHLSEDKKKRKLALQEWYEIFNNIQKLLRLAAQTCYTQLTMDESTKDQFFMSVTEAEVNHGLINAPGDPRRHCLCFIRIIDDLTRNLDDEKAEYYIDMTEADVDEEAQALLTKLRDEKVTSKLQDVNRNLVHWARNNGITKATHQEYLAKFAEDFYRAVTCKIDSAVVDIQKRSANVLYTEVLQHLTMAAERCERFHGRQIILENIKSYFDNPVKQPYVVYGVSGSGKTSVMARVASEVPDWLGSSREPMIITRFLGTSPSSSTIRQTLLSVCHQISANYDRNETANPPSDYSSLLLHFSGLLTKYPTKEKPLVIILDSLDQLSSENYAHQLPWLPWKLPENVFVIVSTLPAEHNILSVLQKHVDECNFVEVESLGESLSFEILLSWLQQKSRKLTEGQCQLVEESFKKCSLPLFVNLIFQQVISWKSYTQVSISLLVHTIHASIEKLFERLEVKHGTCLVTHAFAYLTASETGLSEAELDDLLSLDDAVLSDVYQYHVPPIRRVPPLLWIRIRHEVSSYLVDREADGLHVTYWYHRQFKEAAINRYLNNTLFVVDIHSAMADYYMGKWHKTPKPFVASEYEMHKLGLNLPEASADRRVPAQPLVFNADNDGGNKQYNTRKLRQCPYHLANSRQHDNLKSLCLFNYQWLYTKLCATSIQQIMRDLDYLLSDPAVLLLKGALNLARSTLNDNPETLALQITGSLLPYSIHSGMEYVEKLIAQCYEQAYKHSVLLPRQHCFPSPGGALQYTLECDIFDIRSNKLLAVSSDSRHLLAVGKQNEVVIWDLNSGEVKQQYTVCPDDDIKLNILSASPDGHFILLATAYQNKNKNPVFVIDTTTAGIVKEIQLERVYKNGFVDNLIYRLVGNRVFVLNMNTQHVDCFDVSTGCLIFEIPEQVSMMEITPNSIFILCILRGSDKLKMYSMISFKEIAEVSGIILPSQMVISKSSKTAFILQPKQAKMINLDDDAGEIGQVIGGIDSEGSTIEETAGAMFVSQSDSFLLMPTHKGVCVYDINKKKLYHKFRIPDEIKPTKHKATGYETAMTPDERTLIVAYEQANLISWNVHSKQQLSVISCRAAKLLVSPDSKMFFTATRANHIVTVWSVDNIQETVYAPITVGKSTVYMAQASNAQVAVLRSYHSTETCVLNQSSGLITCWLSTDYEVMRPTVTNNGEYAVLREYESEAALKIWHCKSGQHVSTLPVSSVQLKSYTLGHNNKLVATHCETTPSEDVDLSVWKIGKHKTQQPAAKIQVTSGGFTCITFAGEDKYLVAVKQNVAGGENYQYTIHGYEISSHKEVFHLLDAKNLPVQVKGSNTNIILYHSQISDELKSKLVEFNVSTQEKCREIDLDTDLLTMSISPNWKYGIDCNCKLVDLQTGKFLHQFFKDTKRFSIFINPKINSDGKYVLWIERGTNMLKVGCTKTYKTIGAACLHSTPQCFDVNVNNVVTVGCDDGRVVLLQIVNEQVVRKADLYRNAWSAAKENHRIQGNSRSGNTRSKMCILV